MASRKHSASIKPLIYIIFAFIISVAGLFAMVGRVQDNKSLSLSSRAYYGSSPTPYWFYCDWNYNQVYDKTDSDNLTWCVYNHSYMHYNCPKTDLDRNDKYEFLDQQYEAECYYTGMNANPYCSNGDYNNNGVIDLTENQDTYRCISGVFGYPPMGGIAGTSGGSYVRGSKLVKCATDPERWPSTTPPAINAGDLSHCTAYFAPMPTHRVPTVTPAGFSYGGGGTLYRPNCNACDLDFNRQICNNEINQITDDCINGGNYHTCYLNGDSANTILKGDCNRDGVIDAGDDSCCNLCKNVTGNGCTITPTP